MDHFFTDHDVLLAKLVEGLQPERALDLGCGSGGNAVCWPSISPGQGEDRRFEFGRDRRLRLFLQSHSHLEGPNAPLTGTSGPGHSDECRTGADKDAYAHSVTRIYRETSHRKVRRTVSPGLPEYPPGSQAAAGTQAVATLNGPGRFVALKCLADTHGRARTRQRLRGRGVQPVESATAGSSRS